MNGNLVATAQNRHIFSEVADFAKKNVKKLVFSHLNINGLSNKLQKLHEILNKGYADIFFLSETKLDPSYPSAQFKGDAYNIHRQGRNSHGGGLTCYVNENIPHKNSHDISVNRDGRLVVQVKQAIYSFYTYRPPISNYYMT